MALGIRMLVRFTRTDRVYWKIGLTACTALYFELLLIRWISTELNIFAYLQNSILVVCFLGLGMGLLFPTANAKILRTSVVALVLLCLLLSVETVRKGLNFVVSGSLSRFHDFSVWYTAVIEYQSWGAVFLFAFALIIIFLVGGIIWGIMVALGRMLGGLLEQAPSPIKAYSFDIGGSLFGISLYSLLGYLSLPPSVWIAVGVLLLAPMVERRMLYLLALSPILTSIAYHYSDADIYWTPYQKIEIRPVEDDPTEYQVSTNNTSYQQIQDNSLARFERRPKDLALSQYDIAARLHPNPESILIAGAGTGNDLAGALRRSQHASVHGVEIDPVIIGLGKKYNVEHPYQNNRVRITVNDARAAFHSFPKKSFDLVITGLLDAHTTPNLSNARLDNFVYTREAIRAVSELLTEDGVLVLSFEPQRAYIVERLRQTLDEQFGYPTLITRVPHTEFGWGGMLFINGNQNTIQSVLEQNPDLADFVSEHGVGHYPDAKVESTTDDWPYLYLEKPLIPTLFYLLAVIVLVLWAATSFRLAGKFVWPPLLERSGIHFFALGFGFVIIQVFIVTKASLLFGSTWIVNSVVILGMLLTILLANWLVSRAQHLPLASIAAVLATVCVILGVISFEPVLSYPLSTRIVIGVLLSGIPSLLSGLLFGWAFQGCERPSLALGSNLFGALLGAMLQSVVFLLGISSLAYLAAGAYVIALFSLARTKLHTEATA